MTVAKQSSGDLRNRVNCCLNKLSDRDTLSMASNELETIAISLRDESFAQFLNCLSATDSSDKSPVRRQCVRLLGVLSAAHGDALSPHLSRMISAVLRRLRDPDSAIRAACVDAVSSITTHVSSPPFSLILKPLVDALFHEQDLNAQIGASLCLSAAVDAAVEPDVAELKKVLPRVLKLVKTESFKPKPSLLAFIGSVVSAHCVKSQSLSASVVSTAIEFLSSEDWAGRKAAAEVLEKVALSNRDFVSELKQSCVTALESRRFDKVKVVRETMNRALEAWRDVPCSSPQDSRNGGDSHLSVSRNPNNNGFGTPQSRKMMQNRSPALSSCSSTSSSCKSVLRNEDKKPCSSSPSRLNIKNFQSRVVPFNFNDESNSTTTTEQATNDNIGNENEFEELSVIRKQLLHIENQQSSLLELLQRFIGNSQKGMISLEKRVDGLEKVLDDMSQGFALSTRRIVGSNPTGNTCCMIPGAEFLSPKFWRKTEGGASMNSKITPFKSNPNIKE